MMSSVRFAFAFALASALLLAPARAATEAFTILGSGDKVGELTADIQGSNVTIHYQIVNNGRGPHLDEHMTLDRGGIPVDWAADGTTAFFGVVHERYRWAAGTATWESQADRGTVAAQKPPLYIADDTTPWSLGVYARALLRRPNHESLVLPGGTMRLEEIKRMTFGTGSAKIPVTVYTLNGIDLAPKIVLLDQQGRLFAHMGQDPGGPPYTVVRAGYEGEYAALQALNLEVQLGRARDLQTKLAHHFDDPIRIRNVRIFDPAAMQLGPLSSVVVFRDKIVSVEPEPVTPAADEVVIDGEGGTLMAGLHDMHSHTTLQTGPLYLAAGVTETRDMGNNNAFLLDLVKRDDAGEIPAPRIVRNGLMEGRSPYSVHMGMIPDTLDQALQGVRWYADHGYWQIKIYNSMTPDWVKPIAAEAHRLGMRVTGHIPAFMTADRALNDGYDEITHLNLLMLSWILGAADTRTPLRITAMAQAADLDLSSDTVRATIDLMKAKNAPLDTTAVIIERLMLSRAGTVLDADKPYLDHMPIGYRRYRMRSLVNATDPKVDEQYRRGFDKALAVMTMLDKNGIRMLPGTDDFTGVSLHRELELYVKAGIPPARVLRMDTLDCEQYFGRDQALGSIARGKLADLILIAGDPTQNISAVRQVRMTMKGGVVYFPAEIYSALDVKPFAPPPPVRPAQVAPRRETWNVPNYLIGDGDDE